MLYLELLIKIVIATQKVGGYDTDISSDVKNTTRDMIQNTDSQGDNRPIAQDVARNVARNVAQDVARNEIDIIEFIKKKIKENNKVKRQSIADELGVSMKTVERIIKRIPNLRYIGRGSNGHWELKE